MEQDIEELMEYARTLAPNGDIRLMPNAIKFSLKDGNSKEVIKKRIDKYYGRN